ncbi:hypothetical protein SAY87_004407 [Trapa incisa]|uniref:DUF4378 domain-containing protein n=1 Tax=Trapa incisa TaxID=236973 RepID=A0AAN7JPE1_9MYRT|nr:hypothetical protein SAY87_004407 [Trapa incisa]
MEVDKRSSKGSGFLNLFDWNGKSRKKLFSHNSSSPESAKQGKAKLEMFPEPRLLQTNAAIEHSSPSSSRRIDWNCNSSSSSVSCNERGNHAPGVVARLMGLESMPTPNALKSCSTPAPNSNSIRGSQYYNKLEAFSRDTRIERFQTEVLPPRSAKPISVTHHKLLSPVKNPAFRPTKNAAHIMEAAARIIEASPKVPLGRIVRPNVTPSFPMRLQDLKLKLEAQQLPKKPRNFKIVNGKSNDRNLRGLGDAKTMKRDVESERGNTSRSWKSNSRSMFPSEQAKVNMQSEGRGQAFSRNHQSEREPKSSQRKTSMNRVNANVLKQNNQKQNSLLDRYGSGSKASSGPNICAKKTRMVNKAATSTEPMSSLTVGTNNQRNLPSSSYSSHKKINPKKGVTSKEISLMQSISTTVLITNDERNVKSEIGADVISFTFTSPIKRCSEAYSPARTFSSINSFANGKSLTFSSPGGSAIGESSLSTLLEQKLRELKDRIECYITDASLSSTSSLKEEDSLSTCASSIQDSESALDHLRSATARHDVEERKKLSAFDSSLKVHGRQKCQLQVIEAMEARSVTSSKSRKDVDYQLPGISNLEAISAAGSSPESTVTCSGEEEPLDLHSAVEFFAAEDNSAELSNTVSSSPFANIRENYVGQALLLDGTNFDQSNNWEIDYIRAIICEAELMLEICLSTHPSEIINPSLFDDLERHGSRASSNNREEEARKLRRKFLFDFVGECLVLKCRDLVMGAPKGWARCTELLRRKSLLVEEIHGELSGGNCVGDMTVDILVDEDMSSKYGKWVDFRGEELEEGADIGQGILSSLLDELVEEFLVLSC